MAASTRFSSGRAISSERESSSLTGSPLPWDATGWRETVDAWIEDSLANFGIAQAGAVEHLRARPWAATARVPTAEGAIYFKASAPSEAHEPHLTLALARRRADVVPEVLRIEPRQAWMLMRDGGPQLRELIAEPPDPAIWRMLLPLYAELQIELCDSVGDLLALSTPDKRPEGLVRAYEDLLSRWPDADPAPPTAEIAAMVEKLGETIPASLAHEEFGDNNILLRDGSPTVIDWAEAAVEHPFCGLVNTFRGLVARWGFDAGGPNLVRFRDVYLEPWTRFAAMPELIELFALAYALGMVCRALAWDRLVAALTGPARDEYAHNVRAWLAILSDTLEGKATLGT